MGAPTPNDQSRHGTIAQDGDIGLSAGHAPRLGGHAHADHDNAGHDHESHGHAYHAHDHGACGPSHGFGHAHSHAPTSFGAAFVAAILLNVGILVAELVGGYWGQSVALIADASHNLSDVLGLCAAYLAYRLGQSVPSARFTYGLGGSTILAALFNAVLLLVVTGALSWAAIQRFFAPEPVAATLVMAVAAIAILVNTAAAVLLASGKTSDLNVRAAVAHMAADAAISAGVVVGALLIKLTGWTWIDPVLSLLINATIIIGTWHLLRESLSMSLAGVPRAVRHTEVRSYLGALPGVGGIHDLHIWAMSTSDTALTAHLVMPQGHPGDGFILHVCRTLRETHGIGHATLQIETSEATACALAPDHVV